MASTAGDSESGLALVRAPGAPSFFGRLARRRPASQEDRPGQLALCRISLPLLLLLGLTNVPPLERPGVSEVPRSFPLFRRFALAILTLRQNTFSYRRQSKASPST